MGRIAIRIVLIDFNSVRGGLIVRAEALALRHVAVLVVAHTGGQLAVAVLRGNDAVRIAVILIQGDVRIAVIKFCGLLDDAA